MAVGACAAEESPPPARLGADAGALSGPVDAGAISAPDAPPFPATVRSLRLRRSVALHLEPRSASKRIGTIARDIRVGWRRVARGEGCDTRWVELEPRGWVCESYVEPSDRPAYGLELPRLQRGAIVPGTYGKLATKGAPTYSRPEDGARNAIKRRLAGSVNVRQLGEVHHRGVTYWKIGRDEYTKSSAIRPLEPSEWTGARLGDDTDLELPIGFAMSARGRTVKVDVFAEQPSSGKSKPVNKVPPRTQFPVLEERDDSVRVGEGQWLRAADLLVARRVPPPPLLLEGERWVGVDLDQQVLIAYEGERPVFVTLVSSGSRKYPSEVGLFRVWVKFAETDMNGQMGDEAPYAVATVPWTQFYAKDLALHTSYWHDKFGEARSHGCINLSPRDARFLYFWSDPQVPAGWTMAHGVVEQPGSLVRVRNADNPEPPFKGYAIRVAAVRRDQLSRAPSAPPDPAP